jgi:hypothetical protein
MRQVTIYTTNRNYSHFIQLAKNLQYVKKIETDNEPCIVDNIKVGLNEVRLFNKGNLETTPAKDFLNEL